MLKKTGQGYTTIICDKCGDYHKAPTAISNKCFYDAGFRVNPRAKKYIHKCWSCLESKFKPTPPSKKGKE
jgi:uncharacterized OB-fold protein